MLSRECGASHSSELRTLCTSHSLLLGSLQGGPETGVLPLAERSSCLPLVVEKTDGRDLRLLRTPWGWETGWILRLWSGYSELVRCKSWMGELTSLVRVESRFGGAVASLSSVAPWCTVPHSMAVRYGRPLAMLCSCTASTSPLYEERGEESVDDIVERRNSPDTIRGRC
jgi:hypothetical protein